MVSARKGQVPIRWYQCMSSEIVDGSIWLKNFSCHKKITKNLAYFGIFCNFGIEALKPVGCNQETCILLLSSAQVFKPSPKQIYNERYYRYCKQCLQRLAQCWLLLRYQMGYNYVHAGRVPCGRLMFVRDIMSALSMSCTNQSSSSRRCLYRHQ